ncbi:unnamed protein product [Clonostachys chloroleuca]|uniref:Uncharacterized protein n=1 Tax=Clonostachys chloroleuca TaxID=1926264 RepID=A0AA35MHB5_9HYPO|nr:unnamed protein product [Clonostachys chloroleuca]
MARVVTVGAEVWVVWPPALHAFVGRHGAHGGSSNLHRRNRPSLRRGFEAVWRAWGEECSPKGDEREG